MAGGGQQICERECREIWWNVVTLQAYMAYDATAAKFNEKLLVDMGVEMKSNDAKLEDIHNMDYANLRKFGCE